MLKTIPQAAVILGLKRQRVHKLVQDERIAATRVGNAWLIEEEEIARFKKIKRPVGAPKKPKCGT